jgi:hypothetical protein
MELLEEIVVSARDKSVTKPSKEEVEEYWNRKCARFNQDVPLRKQAWPGKYPRSGRTYFVHQAPASYVLNPNAPYVLSNAERVQLFNFLQKHDPQIIDSSLYQWERETLAKKRGSPYYIQRTGVARGFDYGCLSLDGAEITSLENDHGRHDPFVTFTDAYPDRLAYMIHQAGRAICYHAHPDPNRILEQSEYTPFSCPLCGGTFFADNPQEVRVPAIDLAYLREICQQSKDDSAASEYRQRRMTLEEKDQEVFAECVRQRGLEYVLLEDVGYLHTLTYDESGNPLRYRLRVGEGNRVECFPRDGKGWEPVNEPRYIKQPDNYVVPEKTVADPFPKLKGKCPADRSLPQISRNITNLLCGNEITVEESQRHFLYAHFLFAAHFKEESIESDYLLSEQCPQTQPENAGYSSVTYVDRDDAEIIREELDNHNAQKEEESTDFDREAIFRDDRRWDGDAVTDGFEGEGSTNPENSVSKYMTTASSNGLLDAFERRGKYLFVNCSRCGHNLFVNEPCPSCEREAASWHTSSALQIITRAPTAPILTPQWFDSAHGEFNGYGEPKRGLTNLGRWITDPSIEISLCGGLAPNRNGLPAKQFPHEIPGGYPPYIFKRPADKCSHGVWPGIGGDGSLSYSCTVCSPALMEHLLRCECELCKTGRAEGPKYRAKYREEVQSFGTTCSLCGRQVRHGIKYCPDCAALVYLGACSTAPRLGEIPNVKGAAASFQEKKTRKSGRNHAVSNEDLKAFILNNLSEYRVPGSQDQRHALTLMRRFSVYGLSPQAVAEVEDISPRAARKYLSAKKEIISSYLSAIRNSLGRSERISDEDKTAFLVFLGLPVDCPIDPLRPLFFHPTIKTLFESQKQVEATKPEIFSVPASVKDCRSMPPDVYATRLLDPSFRQAVDSVMCPILTGHPLETKSDLKRTVNYLVSPIYLFSTKPNAVNKVPRG